MILLQLLCKISFSKEGRLKVVTGGIEVVFGQDALPLRNKEYIENSTVYTKIACNVLSYIRDHVPYYNGKPWSFESLQILARKAQTNFMFLKAFFTKDMSEIENDERFIGIFYK